MAFYIFIRHLWLCVLDARVPEAISPAFRKRGITHQPLIEKIKSKRMKIKDMYIKTPML